jgi:SNF2 family DNA or RNA helicase
VRAQRGWRGAVHANRRGRWLGGKDDREAIRRFEWFPTDTGNARTTALHVKFHVLLTTFEMINLDDASELQGIEWRALIVDEAQVRRVAGPVAGASRADG